MSQFLAAENEELKYENERLKAEVNKLRQEITEIKEKGKGYCCVYKERTRRREIVIAASLQ